MRCGGSTGWLLLTGTDPEADPLGFKITLLPSREGALYQCVSGARGALIGSPGTEVSDPGGRVIFAPPATAAEIGRWRLQFVAKDGEYDSSPAVLVLAWIPCRRFFANPAGQVQFRAALCSRRSVNPLWLTTAVWFEWGTTSDWATCPLVTRM